MNIDMFLAEVELVVVLVSHDEIKNNQDLLSEKVVYDTRNILNKSKKMYRI